MPPEPVIGTEVPVRDAKQRVVGTVRYTLDHAVDGMVHARAVRSPVPHARIRAVDASQALREPGVLAVITGAELRREGIRPFFGSERDDQTTLALDRVRYAGEPVALVVAATRKQAGEALPLVDVEYEELPFVVDPVEATQPGTPQLHDDYPGNICAEWQLRHGDIDAGWAQADRIYEHEYASPAASHVPMEPHVAVARWEGPQLEVWSSTQAPYAVRRALARLFDAEQERVRVHVLNLGGAYGSKTTVKIEPMVACAALLVRRPVRMELDRDEVFVTLAKHDASVRIRTGVTEDGRLTARQMRVVWNAGAYSDTSPGGTKAGLVRAPGPYRIPHAWIDSTAVYTNTMPRGPFRGAYTSQLCWAYESQLDDIAADLGLDPVELRRRNLLRSGDGYATGETMREVHFLDLLDEVAKGIDWSTPSASSDPVRRRGKGVAVMIKSQTTPARSEVTLRLRSDGRLMISSSSVEMGQGASTTLAQIAADATGVPLDQVDVPFPDTACAPYDLKTAASRTTFTMGSAIRAAAAELAAALSRLAAKHRDCESGDYRRLLALEGLPEVVVDGVYQSRDGLATLDERGQGNAADHWHQGAVGVEVEVDTETGRLTVLRCHAVAYAGRMVSPPRVRQQNEGSAIFGLGQTLFEEVVFDHGYAVNPNLSEYMIPSILDIPADLTSSAVESPDPAAELYGVGEMAVPPMAPAIANALFQATGVRVRTLPLTPERVLRALLGAPES